MRPPDWPRMLRRKNAALYCDMTETVFEKQVASARFPMPVEFEDGPRWSRPQLDAALDRLTGDRVPDWRAKSPLWAGEN